MKNCAIDYLKAIYETLKTMAGIANPDPAAPTAGFAVPDVIRTSSSGTIPAGAIYVHVTNVGGSDGTFLGETLGPDESMPFPTANGLLLPAMAYDGTGTSLLINIVAPPA